HCSRTDLLHLALRVRPQREQAGPRAGSRRAPGGGRQELPAGSGGPANGGAAAPEGWGRRFPEVDEFLIEVYRRGTLDEVRLLVELTGAAETGRRVDEALRAALGIRIDVVPVPLRSLPRYELKARRVVLRQGHA